MGVIMKRSGGAVLAFFGSCLILLGLLFVVGSDGQMRRLAIGCLGLTLGAVTAGLGVRMFKRADLESPEQLRAEILELARQRNGEISDSDVGAVLGRRRAPGMFVLETMVGEGVCRRAGHQGSTYFIFPHLQPRLMARYCQYCDAEFAISDESEDCPNCGGTLETRVAARSLSEGAIFNMDE